MENLTGIMERDYGFKSGKNAPMVSSSSGGSNSSGAGYGGLRKSMPSGRMSGNSASAYGQDDPFGIGRKNEGSRSGRSSYGSKDDLFSAASYHDVFGGPPKMNDGAPRYDEVYGGAPQDGAPAFDDWGGFGGSTPKVVKSGSFHSSPRPSDRNHYSSFDPAYDELIPGFGFMPKSRVPTEMKSAQDPDLFVPLGNDPVPSSSGVGSNTYDDGLLPGFGSESRSSPGDAKSSREPDPLMPIFDEPHGSSIPSGSSHFVDDGLLPGFGNGDRSQSFRDIKGSHNQDSFGSLGDDPVSSGIPSTSPAFDDLLNVFDDSRVPPSSSSSRGHGNGVKVDRFDGFESFPPSPVKSSFFKDSSRKAADDGGRTSGTGIGSMDEATSMGGGFKSDDISELSPDDPYFPTHIDLGKSGSGLGSSEKQGEEGPGWDFPSSDEQQRDRGSTPNSLSKELKDWLTLEDLKLQTRPSHIPPPSRRPPSLPGSKDKLDSRDAGFVTSSSSTSTPEEDRTVGKTTPPPSYEQANPGWMDFKPARDVERDREARAARERRRQEREEAKASRESREKEIEEREAKLAREQEAKQAREQERLRREKEREKDRAAVRVATQEARERAAQVAAQEAREKAERSAVERITGEARVRAAAMARAKAERAAVEKATAEARERAEQKAAVERASAEARERAERAAAEKAAAEKSAAEQRERAMRAAAEKAAEKAAVERAQSEARERAARVAAEKAAAERVAAEARERAEKAAAEKAARERSHQQNKSENDLESFFAHSAPPASSESRRPASMNNVGNASAFAEPRRTSSGAATTTASVDEWASIFGSSSNSDAPQDNKRGTDNARSSRRNERNLNTSQQRAAKAIAEINQRDIESQREQAERQRAGDALDGEIKRWAAGKEGNLRALLSTLQYVLWPESGWIAVSLTDLINPNAVKKTYKKATLYVHPDKVQQKGATVQQKYIAEKVFDLLKEAFNKFNSEELF